MGAGARPRQPLEQPSMNAVTRPARDIEALRVEVGEWTAENLPEDIRRKVLLRHPLEKLDFVRWMRRLNDKGWLIGHWPVEYGGSGWSHLERWVFENELYRRGAPWLAPFGVVYVGPVIYTFGNEAQKQRWLKPTVDQSIWWAQGYSERGAGSDLASLKTRAVRDGDHYVVNGHKIWTTMAQWADMMFTLVRTDATAKPQHGISFLLIDLKSPGVTIRPIRTLDGGDDLNEVFLDDVRVPVENLIGEEGGGWTCAKFLLDSERLISAEVGKAERLLVQLRFFLDEVRDAGVPLAQSPAWISRVAELEFRLCGLRSLCRAMFRELDEGRDPGLSASMLKIVSAELLQAIAREQIDALSTGVLSLDAESCDTGSLVPQGAAGALGEYLFGRVYSIWGGTSEIQRNIIAKGVLGL
jgi:alkylation response protein AidB-like acyl-CoA dehydrogenase